LTQNYTGISFQPPSGILWCDVGFSKQSIGQVLAWKSGLKMPLLPYRPSCPLQTILLSDLVGYDNLLQIVMSVWRTFFKFEVRQIPLLSAAGWIGRIVLWEHITTFFSRVKETLWGHITAFIFYEYERVEETVFQGFWLRAFTTFPCF
jgi:hypothetical protein